MPAARSCTLPRSVAPTSLAARPALNALRISPSLLACVVLCCGVVWCVKGWDQASPVSHGPPGEVCTWWWCIVWGSINLSRNQTCMRAAERTEYLPAPKPTNWTMQHRVRYLQVNTLNTHWGVVYLSVAQPRNQVALQFVFVHRERCLPGCTSLVQVTHTLVVNLRGLQQRLHNISITTAL
jgi:hypothetical protein